jgi:dihydroorotase-like cyclic amidohydrolase
MKFDRVVTGGNVVTPGGDFVGDVGIIGEKIAAIGEALDTAGADVVDAAGHHVIPGVLGVVG